MTVMSALADARGPWEQWQLTTRHKKLNGLSGSQKGDKPRPAGAQEACLPSLSTPSSYLPVWPRVLAPSLCKKPIG